MDNFMDKLVERINAQGAMRSQSMSSADERRRSANTADTTKQLAEYEAKLTESFVNSVSAAVRESTQKNEELIAAFKKENIESRISATEEMMAAQASAREALIEKIEETMKKSGDSDISAIIAKAQEELSENIHKDTVKCYRNTQAIIEEASRKQLEAIEKSSNGKTIRNLLIAALILLGANLAGAITIILWMFRVI